MTRRILFLWVILVMSAHADPPFKPIDANYERRDVQWDLETSVANTTLIRCYNWQGTNAWYGGTNYTFVFRFSKSDSSETMGSITGVVSGAQVDFQAEAGTFTKPCKDWYSVVLVYEGSEVYSYAHGNISVKRSPEVDAAGALARTYAVDGSLYGPFTGSFEDWPFITTNSATVGITNMETAGGTNFFVEVTNRFATITHPTNLAYFADDVGYATDAEVDAATQQVSVWVTSEFVDKTDAAYVAALTNLTGGTGIDVTGSGRERTIAVDSTIATESYVDGATGALHTTISAEIDSDVAAGTNAVSAWVLTLGYVTESVTNGLASTNWVLAQSYVTEAITNGLVTAAVTNDLASTNWIIAQGYVTAAITNGLVTEAITNGLASTNWVLNLGYVTASVTNGLASTNWVLNQSYVTESITNGLASIIYVGTATGTLHTTISSEIDSDIVTATNAVSAWADGKFATGTPVYVESDPLSLHLDGGTVTGAVHMGSNLWVGTSDTQITDVHSPTGTVAANTFVGVNTDTTLVYRVGLVPSDTNSLASTNWVITQGYVTEAVTNGLVTEAITNGLVTAAITNGLASTNWVLNQSYVTEAITNGLVTEAVTNGLVTAAITNALGNTNWAYSIFVELAGDTMIGSLIADDGVGDSPDIGVRSVSNHTGWMRMDELLGFEIETDAGNITLIPQNDLVRISGGLDIGGTNGHPGNKNLRVEGLSYFGGITDHGSNRVTYADDAIDQRDLVTLQQMNQSNASFAVSSQLDSVAYAGEVDPVWAGVSNLYAISNQLDSVAYAGEVDPAALHLNGDNAMTAPLNMGGQKGTNAAAGSADDHFATVGQMNASNAVVGGSWLATWVGSTSTLYFISSDGVYTNEIGEYFEP